MGDRCLVEDVFFLFLGSAAATRVATRVEAWIPTAQRTNLPEHSGSPEETSVTALIVLKELIVNRRTDDSGYFEPFQSIQ